MTPIEFLEQRARRAYERGRWRRAGAVAALAVGVGSLCLLVCPPGPVPVCGLLALGAVIAVALWRGGPAARGARVGMIAGAVPFALPILVGLGHGCSAALCLTMPVVCAAGGLVAGVSLGAAGGRDRRFWLAAVPVTLLAGTLGCLVAGLAGLGGMALGVAIGAAPPLLARALAGVR